MAPDINALDWMALERRVEHLRKDRTHLSALMFDCKVYRLRKGKAQKYDFIKAWAHIFDLPVEELLRGCYL